MIKNWPSLFVLFDTELLIVDVLQIRKEEEMKTCVIKVPKY